jgi:hypothetical protein
MDTFNWFSLTMNLVSTAVNTVQLWFSRPTTPGEETAYIRAFRGAYWRIAQYLIAFQAIKHLLEAEQVEDRGLDLGRYIEALATDDYYRLRHYSQDLRTHIDRLANEGNIIRKHYSQSSNMPVRYLRDDPWFDAYQELKGIESQLRQLQHDPQISLGHMTDLVEDVSQVQRAFGTALDIDVSIGHDLTEKAHDVGRASDVIVEKAGPRFERIHRPERDLGIELDLGFDR